MEKFGLIGHPIAHSLSPALFEAAYSGRYSYDLIEGESFENSYRRFLEEEYKAINVTAPFKENAFAQAVGLARDGMGSVSGPCWKTGATNLMVKTPQGMEARNSDFTGIILSVAEAFFPGLVEQCYELFGDKGYIKVHQFVRQNLGEKFSLRPQALVVGCGGAGKAAAVAAAEMGFSTAVMNRTFSKARELAASLPEYSFIPDGMEDFAEAFRECDLIIYTLPVPLGQIVPDASLFTTGKVILEANYKNPAFSGAVLEALESSGAKYISGRRWLLYQALTGYSMMTGEVPDLEAMEKALSLPLPDRLV